MAQPGISSSRTSSRGQFEQTPGLKGKKKEELGNMSTPRAVEHLKVLNQFIGKSDGKDKLCATIQYACLFLSAGHPGNVKKVQASVAAARKVFRILKPLETLTPLLINQESPERKPLAINVLAKLKSILMAGYFTFDHFVWSGQAGLITDTSILTRAQKTSSYCWFGGSLCTIICECHAILELCSLEKGSASDEDWVEELSRIKAEVNRRSLVLLHACFQACLAVGLLQLMPLKLRTVGLIGFITSALNCYMLLPPLPKNHGKTVKND